MSFMFPSWILLRRILSQVNKFHPHHQLRLMVNKNGRWKRYWMLVSAIDILNTSSSGLDMMSPNGCWAAMSMNFKLSTISTAGIQKNLGHYQRTKKTSYYEQLYPHILGLQVKFPACAQFAMIPVYFLPPR